MSWTVGMEGVKGPGDEEMAGADASGESVYFGPSPNGTRRDYGIPPPNGRNQPWSYPVQSGIGGRTPGQPVLNGTVRVPWRVPLNGTTNPLGVANPNGFARPFGLNPRQFSEGQEDGYG